MRGLVLSGGGARGAYQVGVLQAVAEICEKESVQNPFKILTGLSAGAINAASLAANTNDFTTGALTLAKLWGNLRSEQVFRTDALALSRTGLRWMGDLSLGGFTGSSVGKSLLDTSPLSKLIADNLNFAQINDRVREGSLWAVGLSAMDYRTSSTVTFVQGSELLPLWNYARKKAEKTQLRVEHVMASIAIPVLFPPVAIDHRYFGDGCVRNQTPCSESLKLGANKILVIGVRKMGVNADEANALRTPGPPSLARIGNVLLNAVLLDNIEADVTRLQNINGFINQVPDPHRERLGFRSVPALFISPSEDIGQIAAKLAGKMPRLIRYLIKGLGPLEDASEVISYLLFEPEFCRELLELGYKDGLAAEEALKPFLLEP